MICGKKDLSQPFHDPFTTHSQPCGNQNPRIPTRLFGVFHKFPTIVYSLKTMERDMKNDQHLRETVSDIIKNVKA